MNLEIKIYIYKILINLQFLCITFLCGIVLIKFLFNFFDFNVRLELSKRRNTTAKIILKDCSTTNNCIYTSSYLVDDKKYEANIEGISKVYKEGDEIEITYSLDEPNKPWEKDWKKKNVSIQDLVIFDYFLIFFLILGLLSFVSYIFLKNNVELEIRQLYQ